MFLTRLELHGFKSFPDRTLFEFDRGITAILGPNGCGKSNVVDAVKWVLGESSAKNLRGKEMQDVIFAGCESRKAMGFAEVSLWFDNRDQTLPVAYPEVCVTRRLYRTGESEYLLNRNPVRRRDVRELFMGTGVATSAYSVIEQGRVEALLAAKPADRRAVFEEAAGVSKYKARRKETAARLERSSQHLARVDDIANEVDKSVRRVSRQAQEARRHQRLRSELEAAKQYAYTRRYRGEARRLAAVRDEILQLEELVAGERAGAGERAQRLARFAREEIELSGGAKDADDRAAECQRELGRVQADLAETRALQSALDQGEQAANEQIDGLRRRVEQLKLDGGDIERQLASAREESARAESALAERDGARAEAMARALAAEAEVDRLRKAVLALSQECTRTQADHRHAEESAAGAEARGRLAAERLQALADDEDAARISADRLRQRLDAAAEEAAEANQRLQVLRDEERRHREEAERRREEAARLDQRHAARTARLAALEEMEKSFAGAFAGVKAVLEARRDGRPEMAGVHGRAVDLMRAPVEYAVAVETILGNQAQDLVVDTARQAQDGIEFLKRERAGRATFVPLDRIRPRRRLERDYTHLPGVIGEAVDLVAFEAPYRRAMEYWLGGILVVDTLSRARELTARDVTDVRVVTLDGDVINPNGAMTGGQGREQRAGLVQRKAEMDALAGEIAEIANESAKMAEYRRAALSAAEAARGRLGAAEAEVAEKLGAGRETERELAGCEARFQALTAERERAAAESGGVETLRMAAREKAAAAAERLLRLEAEREQAAADTEAALARQAEARAAVAADADALADLREARASAAAGVAELERRLAAAHREHDERQGELDKHIGFQFRAGSERETLAERLRVLREREEAGLRARDEADAQRGALRERLAALKEWFAAEREEERAAESRAAQGEKAVGDLRVREQQALLKMENLALKAREEIGVDDLAGQAAEWERQEAAAAAIREAARQEREEAERERFAAESFAAAFAAGSGGSASPFRDEEAAADGLAGAEPVVVAPVPLNAPPVEPSAVDYGRMDDAELDALMADLAGKLQRIGPVNTMAIEELAELEARAAFLKAEQDDLRTAVADLRSVIERLNEESGKRFGETFETVRVNFQRMFTRLFSGGTADLVLEQSPPDENGEIPDPGIDIIARPPGKRAERISLLSGGEKALCAVALLFAIFESKPSPFCILDEVDGPLDESNIDLFMGQVREFSQGTQFILISHSKFTMGKTDTIYGVTQEERGVSRKYSWRFGGDAESAPTGSAPAEPLAVAAPPMPEAAPAVAMEPATEPEPEPAAIS